MLVSKFKNAMASVPQDIDIVKVANKICSDQDIYDNTKVYKQMTYPNQVSGYKEYKLRNFPAITPATLMYAGKTRNHIVGLTGLCFLDIDHIRKEVRMQFLMNKLRQDNHVMLAYKSVSGRGLHVLIRYSIQDRDKTLHTGTRGPIRISRLYKQVFDYIAAEYEKNLLVVADKHAQSPEHMCVLSHDQDCYFNPDAKPLLIEIPI